MVLMLLVFFELVNDKAGFFLLVVMRRLPMLSLSELGLVSDSER